MGKWLLCAKNKPVRPCTVSRRQGWHCLGSLAAMAHSSWTRVICRERDGEQHVRHARSRPGWRFPVCTVLLVPCKPGQSGGALLSSTRNLASVPRLHGPVRTAAAAMPGSLHAPLTCQGAACVVLHVNCNRRHRLGPVCGQAGNPTSESPLQRQQCQDISNLRA